MSDEIMNEIRKKGLLLEKEVYEMLNSFNDKNNARVFLEQVEQATGQRMITKNVLRKNAGFVKSFVRNLSEEEKNVVERVFVNLGLSFEVTSEREIVSTKKKYFSPNYKVFYSDTKPETKLEVKDFTNHFRARYQALQKILMERIELQKELVSIGRISSERSSFSVIGIVKEKRVTKNKNIIIGLEDMTGEIIALVRFEREELFQKAEELQLDDVVGVKASGNRDMVFIHDIFFPDAFLAEKMRFEEEICVAFLSDVHCGSDRHLKKSFQNFLDWINSEDETAKKVMYLFFSGDNVDGVGIFPGQESVLELKSMREQYKLLASYLKKLPKRVTSFMCPGQHDAARVAEPQPIISKKYAPYLYEIENLVMVTNPTVVKLCEGEKEFKILMYHGASIHYLINEIKRLRVMKSHSCPAKAVCEMLKRRHLAPSHSSVVYIPNGERDPLVISEVPDVMITGEVHRPDIEMYNGVLIITGSCWQAQTPFEEKVGNISDPAKVPILNLKTRELKVFDFGVREEIEREY